MKLRIFCTTLIAYNNIKVVIEMHTFLFDQVQNKEYRFNWSIIIFDASPLKSTYQDI